jgi:Zn-dependent metalloprotease
VQGAGNANRAQVERAFFRAMTVLMPNAPTMQLAGAATVQAATDLYGANSAVTTAIRQAMQAVGLIPSADFTRPSFRGRSAFKRT